MRQVYLLKRVQQSVSTFPACSGLPHVRIWRQVGSDLVSAGHLWRLFGYPKWPSSKGETAKTSPGPESIWKKGDRDASPWRCLHLTLILWTVFTVHLSLTKQFLFVATDSVRQYFQDCVSSFTGTVTLPYLSRLEKKIAENFKFREFGQLHQGSFLEFLVKNVQVCPDHRLIYISLAVKYISLAVTYLSLAVRGTISLAVPCDDKPDLYSSVDSKGRCRMHRGYKHPGYPSVRLQTQPAGCVWVY